MKRRAFLAASAALPVTGAVAAGLPAETTTEDAELLRLGDELDRARARITAVSTRLSPMSPLGTATPPKRTGQVEKAEVCVPTVVTEGQK